MNLIDYGVVQQAGRWTIIGAHLRYGAFPERSDAVEAVMRLAETSVRGVRLHLQDENGELHMADWGRADRERPQA